MGNYVPRISAIHAQVTKLISQMQSRLDNQRGCSQTTLQQYEALSKDITKLQELCYACSHNGSMPPTQNIIMQAQQPISESITDTEIVSTKEITCLQDTSSTDKRAYMNEYGRTLFNIYHCYHAGDWIETSTGYPALDKLVKLLYKWYDCRLMKSYTSNITNGKYWSRLKYKLDSINQVIYAITILYGYHYEVAHRREDPTVLNNFIDSMDDWLADLYRNQYIAENYLCPEAINNFIIQPDTDYFTDTALILWDLLLRAGFQPLCNTYVQYTDAPKTHGLDDLYKVYAPDILDNYQGIDDIEYLEKYGI